MKMLSIGMIPSSLYGQILKYMPIPSVEAMIVMNKSLLLLRRKNNPAMGQWWFAGGRIRKGESLEEALFREVKEETDLDVNTYKFVDVYSRVFPERHDIAIVYLCTCKDGKVVLNDEHSEYKFFKNMPVGIHPYLLETIQDSEWRKYC
ncbi:MAG: NUDIX hydrolase [Candidatus Bathyarchaeota archaeon]|nr:NUDIX hydrolase [Candidatus Bathyarchaeota archaeon]